MPSAEFKFSRGGGRGGRRTTDEGRRPTADVDDSASNGGGGSRGPIQGGRGQEQGRRGRAGEGKMKGSLKDSKEFLKLSKPSAASKSASSAPYRANASSKSASSPAGAAFSTSGTTSSSSIIHNPLFSSKLCPSLCRSSDSELALKWYQLPLASRVLSPPAKNLSPEHVSQRQVAATAALEHQANLAKQGIQGSTTDFKWLADVLKKGTVSDRVAALTLLVQESPIHRCVYLDQLLTMAGKQSRRESMPVLLALQDLFLSDLLPDRKLLFFRENVLRQPPDCEQEALFQFEHTLKLAYATYIKALSSALHDPVVHIRQEAIRVTHAILKSKPEQEQALLFILVNKLGDAERKVASSVCHVLHKLLMTHPAMTEVVAKEVMRLLFDAKTSSRARYYGLVFLSQIVLTKNHRDVAVQLVECYAKIFKMQHISPKSLSPSSSKSSSSAAASKKSKGKAAAAPSDDKDCGKKVLPVVLAGINRALPFASASGGGSRSTAAVEALMESLFETVEVSLGSFSASTQALLVLQQLLPGASTSTCSRFYSALYARVISPDLRHASKPAMFLNCVYKALKDDSDAARASAFVKRALQVCAGGGVPPKSARVMLLMRSLQACCSLPANVACGIIILLAEASKSNVAVAQGMARALTIRAADADVDDEEEVFRDAPDSDDERAPQPAPAVVPAKTIKKSAYNPRCPAPEHAAADGVPLFELAPLFNHYHPSVNALISAFIKGKVTPSGDPLKDLTPGSFLDKFVFRKPKKKGQGAGDDDDGNSKGGSIMQPLTDPSSRTATDILSRAFQATPLDEAQPDERFFIRFFQERRGRAAKAKREKKKKGTEEEEEAEEGLDDLLGGALDDSESDDDDDGDDDDGDGHHALPGDESDEEVEFSDGDEDDGSAADWAGYDEDEDELAVEGDQQQQAERRMMKEIEEMSSDEDDFATGCEDEDDDDEAQSRHSRSKRAATSDLRGGRGSKKVTGRAGGSTFASADDFGAEVDDWHAQLIQANREAEAPSSVPKHQSLQQRGRNKRGRK